MDTYLNNLNRLLSLINGEIARDIAIGRTTRELYHKVYGRICIY